MKTPMIRSGCALPVMLGIVFSAADPAPKALADNSRQNPPAQTPPDEAKGRQLAEFIKQAKARGLKGRELARAIAEERKRLGLPPED